LIEAVPDPGGRSRPIELLSRFFCRSPRMSSCRIGPILEILLPSLLPVTEGRGPCPNDEVELDDSGRLNKLNGEALTDRDADDRVGLRRLLDVPAKLVEPAPVPPDKVGGSCLRSPRGSGRTGGGRPKLLDRLKDMSPAMDMFSSPTVPRALVDALRDFM
jgi:hypothetical protein